MSPSRTASGQIQSRTADTSSSDRFALSELQELPAWTSLHVFAPYTPTATINQRLGFKWPDADRFRLHERDDIHLAVFVSGSTVVRVEEWKRTPFDCSPALSGKALLPTSVLRIDRSKPTPLLDLSDVADSGRAAPLTRQETNPSTSTPAR
jgi:hypothetical protein